MAKQPVYESTEVSDWCAESQVDEANGIVRNVVLCGNKSKNGYGIPEKAFGGIERVRELYEGKPVFLNHPDSPTKPRDRRVQDVGGKIINVRLEAGRPRGDIDTNHAPQGKIVLEMSKARMTGVGMSHVARYTNNKTKTAVESVDEVVSVDLVAFPATTSTFHENQTGVENMETVDLLTKQLADQKTQFESQIAALNTDKTTLVTAKTSLESQVTTLTTERDGLNTKVAQFESERNIAIRKNWIVEKCKEHKLNPDDKVVFTEAFMGVLLATPEDATREALIKGMKSAMESAASGKSPGIISQERQNGQKTAVNYESLAQAAGVPVFA